MMAPSLFHHQLVGDSHFVRLAVREGWQLEGVSPARIGLCVSGQQVRQLYEAVQSHGTFAANVMCLIGTNDLINDTKYHSLKGTYFCLISTLLKTSPGVVLLTLPPAPRCWGNERYRRNLLAINKWLMGWSGQPKDVVMIVMSQGDTYNAEEAQFLKEDVLLQSQKTKQLPPVVHLFHEDFLHPGAWKILPVITRKNIPLECRTAEPQNVARLVSLLTCFYNEGQKPLVVGEYHGYRVSEPMEEEFPSYAYGYNYATGGRGVVLNREAVHLLSESDVCICPTPDAPDDMVLLGVCLSRLGISITHSPSFHQARPLDYPAKYLKAQYPVSFHKHWIIDPVNVHREWFAASDEEMKIEKSGIHDEL